MTEIKVKQNTEEWLDLRQSMCLTASRFGDAIGIGKGRPGDFIRYVVMEPDDLRRGPDNPFTHHGHAVEPLINEAYQLLMNIQTHTTGFWIPDSGSPLYGMVGASPDALVLDADGCRSGIVEYKAPVHRLCAVSPTKPNGIHRSYMTQMQAQMALTSTKWCDFMAVCCATKDITLKRIHFQPHYWQYVEKRLEIVCNVIKDARRRQKVKLSPFEFPAAEAVLSWPTISGHLPDEEAIRVENLLVSDGTGQFRIPPGAWMPYDLLMGEDHTLPERLKQYGESLLGQSDAAIIAAHRESTQSNSKIGAGSSTTMLSAK